MGRGRPRKGDDAPGGERRAQHVMGAPFFSVSRPAGSGSTSRKLEPPLEAPETYALLARKSKVRFAAPTSALLWPPDTPAVTADESRKY